MSKIIVYNAYAGDDVIIADNTIEGLLDIYHNGIHYDLNNIKSSIKDGYYDEDTWSLFVVKFHDKIMSEDFYHDKADPAIVDEMMQYIYEYIQKDTFYLEVDGSDENIDTATVKVVEMSSKAKSLL